jgi:hypothetical protein
VAPTDGGGGIERENPYNVGADRRAVSTIVSAWGLVNNAGLGHARAGPRASPPVRTWGSTMATSGDIPAEAAGQANARLIQEVPTGAAGFNKTTPEQARRMNELDRTMQSKFGVTLNQHLMDLREAIAADGFDGLKRMAAKTGFPLEALFLMASVPPKVRLRSDVD